MSRATIEGLAAGRAAQVAAVRDEDAVHDGFIRTLVKVDREEVANPQGYWYVASRRALIDRARRKAAERRALRRWAEQAGHEPDIDDEADIPAEALGDAIAGLNERGRALVELELAGVVGAAELADRLGTTAGNIRVLRHRTYRRLAEILGDRRAHLRPAS